MFDYLPEEIKLQILGHVPRESSVSVCNTSEHVCSDICCIIKMNNWVNVLLTSKKLLALGQQIFCDDRTLWRLIETPSLLLLAVQKYTTVVPMIKHFFPNRFNSYHVCKLAEQLLSHKHWEEFFLVLQKSSHLAFVIALMLEQDVPTAADKPNCTCIIYHDVYLSELYTALYVAMITISEVNRGRLFFLLGHHNLCVSKSIQVRYNQETQGFTKLEFHCKIIHLSHEAQLTGIDSVTAFLQNAYLRSADNDQTFFERYTDLSNNAEASDAMHVWYAISLLQNGAHAQQQAVLDRTVEKAERKNTIKCCYSSFFAVFETPLVLNQLDYWATVAQYLIMYKQLTAVELLYKFLVRQEYMHVTIMSNVEIIPPIRIKHFSKKCTTEQIICVISVIFSSIKYTYKDKEKTLASLLEYATQLDKQQTSKIVSAVVTRFVINHVHDTFCNILVPYIEYIDVEPSVFYYLITCQCLPGEPIFIFFLQHSHKFVQPWSIENIRHFLILSWKLERARLCNAIIEVGGDSIITEIVALKEQFLNHSLQCEPLLILLKKYNIIPVKPIAIHNISEKKNSHDTSKHPPTYKRYRDTDIRTFFNKKTKRTP